ncbi:hypothetical protein TNCV_1456241 [Trichonephila clavipes]|nr:hypothetical protein TNCV_1456241 [Trichonephila clavipes]
MDNSRIESGRLQRQMQIQLGSDDNRLRVWRPSGERLNPAFGLQRYTTPTTDVIEHNVLDNVIFMQDGALTHTTTGVKKFMKKTFTDERVLCRYFTQCPLHSPDLTLNDFWFLAYDKSRVNRYSPVGGVEGCYLP